MARHRNVRTMNYEDEYYDEDDMYGHSVEDNYCISPGTAAQFTFNRDRGLDLSTYMGHEEGIPEEDEETEEEGTPRDQHRGSLDYTRPQLSDIEEANLNSCLEEIRNILGESVPENIMVDTVIKNNFSLETSLNVLLSAQEAPKPQREPRNRRNRSQEFDDIECDGPLTQSQSPDLECDSPFIQFDNPFIPKGFAGGKTKFGYADVDNCGKKEREQTDSSGKFKDKKSIGVQLVEKSEGTLDSLPKSKFTAKTDETITKFDMSEKIKSLSEHVSKMSVKDSATHQPLSPNSNKENIPLRKTKPGHSSRALESQVTIRDQLSDSRHIHAEKTRMEVVTKNQNQSDMNNSSSSPITKPHQKSATVTSQGVSLAELAKIHESKSREEKSLTTLTNLSAKSEKVQSLKFSLAELATKHEGVVQMMKPKGTIALSSKTSPAELAMKQSTKTPVTEPTVTLSELSRQTNIKSVGLNSKPSLAELAKKHECKTQIAKPTVTQLDTGVEDEKVQTSDLKPSLVDLIMKHDSEAQTGKLLESQTVQKPSLADLAKKQSGYNEPSESVQAHGPDSKQNDSLVKLTSKTMPNTLQQFSMKQKDTESNDQSAGLQPKLSLADLANKFQQQKEKEQSKSKTGDNENKHQKSNVSLEHLAKTKNIIPGSEVSNEMKEKSKLGLSDSLRKLIISDKTKDFENSEDLNVDTQKDVRSEVIFECADNLIIAEVNKFTTGASKLGKVLCLKMKVKESGNSGLTVRKYKTRRFTYQSQIKGRKSNSPVHVRKIIPYDFSDPSPDDVVKQRQKAAFSRTGERKISN